MFDDRGLYEKPQFPPTLVHNLLMKRSSFGYLRGGFILAAILKYAQMVAAMSPEQMKSLRADDNPMPPETAEDYQALARDMLDDIDECTFDWYLEDGDPNAPAAVGITVNLFQNHNGGGSWLYVWSGDATEEKVTLAIQLERALRDDFVRGATADYALAVEWVRSVVSEMNSTVEIAIFDRGLEQ